MRRFFELIPGLLIWILLFAPVWAGIFFPIAIINTLVFLSVYWVYRSTILTIGALVGFYRSQEAIKTDWNKKIKELNRKELTEKELLPKGSLYPKHLIVIAHYGEEYEVIQKTIKAITEQNYPLDKIFISVSVPSIGVIIIYDEVFSFSIIDILK